MIVKILGIGDIIASLILFALCFTSLPKILITIFAFYLVGKGLAFIVSLDVGSFFDIAGGILLFLSLSFTLPNILLIIAAVLILQKGIFSMF